MGTASGTSGSGPTEADIQLKPWKYIGYKGYAEFISSDDDFLILRRFDSLSARVALRLQDEINVLEEELERLDTIHSKPESTDFNNGTLRDDIAERAEILELAARKLRRYNEFLLQHSRMKKLTKAPGRDIKSLKHWHYNHSNVAIAREEQTYLNNEDLVRVVQEDRTPLRRVIDSSLRLRTLPIWRLRKHEAPVYDADYVSYYSGKRIDGFASTMIVTIGATMLIAPIWILQALNTLTMKLGVITIFILIFLLLISFAMVSKPFEALGATAAYAAVLMVFIQFGTEKA
ncbi:hypothetical protein N656DRAFT_709377 [Canariomyces notabilis]|uniref:DUF6594 domain-containing protein n=1 Tax=Canariomyces notabilis TaxID=2074819 RepID=A0AAN6TDK2_9PEZI|nr:hypothetical protein N656DRAFT_709377 [Canariomyces arenarius]